MSRDLDALLIDAGGVLTSDLFPSFDAHLARAGLRAVSFRELYFGAPQVQALLHRLEVGELEYDEVQGPLAKMIGLRPEHADDLFPGLYRDVEFVPAMTDAVETLRRAGIRTGLLSNSWWGPMYDLPFYERAFDVQIISGRAGVRKPDRAIYELGLEQLGVVPERVLFVDDFEENLPPARALGMEVFLHDPDDPGSTIAELSRRFGVALG